MDDEIRAAAFATVRHMVEVGGELTPDDLAAGFQFRGERIPLVNMRQGIFKPQRLQHLLSIRTVYPVAGRRVWYDDQREVHQQIYQGSEAVDYAFMGENPDAAQNRWLREAMEVRVPVIYFLGVSPRRYQAFVPTYVTAWDATTRKAQVAFGVPGEASLEYPATAGERRYALREVKQRLHQSSFRDAVISAYRGRCAITNLPEQRLLDAAHIVSDKDEKLGQPIVPNGIPLSKIHHAAFDAHLIGIDPDFKIHVARRLLLQNDGPMLELLKKLHGMMLHLPERTVDRPDQMRLAQRFDVFRGYE